MTFLYFVPDWQVNLIESVDIIPVDAVKKIIRDSKGFQGFQCNYGPGPRGRNGTFVAACPAAGSGGSEWPSSIEFDRSCVADESDDASLVGDKQCWREVRNADETTCYWVGWNKADKPNPSDLQRNNLVAGHPVLLGDGNEWQIPVVGPSHSRLPYSFKVNAKGELEQQVHKDFRKLFKDSESIRERFYHDGVPSGEMWLYATALLAVNYRVGPHETAGDILDLFTTENYIDVFKVSIGIRDIEIDEQVKKNSESDPADS